jgi:hypothetical protein
MLANPNKMLLTQTVTIEKHVGENEYGDPLYDSPITLTNVRFDQQDNFEGTGNNKELTSSGVVFVYQFVYQGPKLDKTWVRSRLTDEDGNQYLVTGIIAMKQDNSNKPYSWELDVVAIG